MIMGVLDGQQGLLSTVAYYRSSYVFVYRVDSPFEIASLDDPVLRELDIGVQRTGIPPHEALLTRGLAGRVVLQYGEREFGGRSDPLAPLSEAIANGEVDVGLAWGPVAGYYAKRQPVELKVVPVTPEIDPPFLSMTNALTIGVRRGDEALRDRLNVALALRWDEIQEVLQEYGVPLKPLPKPMITVGGE
jgi:ABC-type amino acid transport substrate-binding protein